jgi:spoIIIJ-associated protein
MSFADGSTDGGDPADRVQEMMELIADAAGIDADVEIREDPDHGLIAEYVGDDLAVLIGHHGQTIDAIQHLAYRLASRGEEPRISVLVDAAGYRERRAVTLRQTADQAAETALREGRPVSLESMSALERKVIHEHLKTRHDLETYSRGQEPARHLVVAPLLED